MSRGLRLTAVGTSCSFYLVGLVQAASYFAVSRIEVDYNHLDIS